MKRYSISLSTEEAGGEAEGGEKKTRRKGRDIDCHREIIPATTIRERERERDDMWPASVKKDSGKFGNRLGCDSFFFFFAVYTRYRRDFKFLAIFSHARLRNVERKCVIANRRRIEKKKDARSRLKMRAKHCVSRVRLGTCEMSRACALE